MPQNVQWDAMAHPVYSLNIAQLALATVYVLLGITVLKDRPVHLIRVLRSVGEAPRVLWVTIVLEEPTTKSFVL